jgi:hypothetical protein
MRACHRAGGGTGNVRHFRQNGVKTRKGRPAWLATVFGSNSSALAKLLTSRPSASSDDATR